MRDDENKSWDKQKTLKNIGVSLLILMSVIAVATAAVNRYKAREAETSEFVYTILDEAIEDAVVIRHVDDAITARVKHRLSERFSPLMIIEVSEEKKEKGEEVFIRARISNKSYYVSRKIN